MNDFIFTGRRIRRQDDGSFHIDQEHYVAEVHLTKIHHGDDEKLSSHPALVTEFRSGIGSLQWMAGTTPWRPSSRHFTFAEAAEGAHRGRSQRGQQGFKVCACHGQRLLQGEPVGPQGLGVHRLRRQWMGECAWKQVPRRPGDFGNEQTLLGGAMQGIFAGVEVVPAPENLAVDTSC